jgi:hypothetical protein
VNAAAPAAHPTAHPMDRSPRPLALLALLASLAGCYTGMNAYSRPRAVIRHDPSRLFDAVRDTVTAQGLRIVQARPERGLVEAVTRPVQMGEVKSRERWHISVRASQVAVEMHPETALDGEAGWERDTRVCDCYHYAREREMLRAIRERAARARPGG